jgi:hypothetical protein
VSALLVDPMGFAAGDSNLYRYVNNRPTNHTDPSGLDSIEVRQDGAIIWIRGTPGKDVPLSPIQSVVIGRSLAPYPYNHPAVRIDGLTDFQPIQALREIASDWKNYLGPTDYNAFWNAAPAAQQQIIAKNLSAIRRTPLGEYGPKEHITELAVMLAQFTGVASVEQAWTGKDLQNNPLSPGERIWLGATGSLQLVLTAFGILRCATGPVAPGRVITRIGDLTAQEQAALARIWEGEAVSTLPSSVREQLAAMYRGVARAPQNAPGSAQAAFNEARAAYLLGEGPNPGPSVNAFAERMGIPIQRRGAN